MANQKHIDILRLGVDEWNKWRGEHPKVKIVLTKADLRETNLSGADLSCIYFSEANLQGADLKEANLSDSDLSRVNLRYADLSDADLTNAALNDTVLTVADLDRACLTGAYLSDANFNLACLRQADLSDADLSNSNLRSANLSGADLTNADLSDADLSDADLSGAKIIKADLSQALLIGANLEGADLVDSRIYGISAWDVKLKDTKQYNLIVTPCNKSEITVDNLEIAQFIYLLINNRKIRDVITTLTSKTVLILGRFTDERKRILNSIKDKCREMKLVPILFDFDPVPYRDLTETVQLLANMSRFVIADVTNAKSIPQELSHIVPNFPSVPVQPILLASQQEYAMFEHWQGFNSVLPVFEYRDEEHLLESFSKSIVEPVDNWTKEKDKTKILEEENAELKRQISKMKRKSTDTK